MSTYNITRWDGERFGPFDTKEDAMDASGNLLAGWMQCGESLRFHHNGDEVVVKIMYRECEHDAWLPRRETLTINKYEESPPVEYEFFVVDDSGDRQGPFINKRASALVSATKVMLTAWFDDPGWAGGDRSETFSIYIERKVKS